MNFDEQVDRKVVELSRLMLNMTTKAGSGHPSSGLSLIHIVTVLMYNMMRYDEKDPWNPENDRLVLSEGHAVPVIYSAYAELGGAIGFDRKNREFLTIGDLDSLRQINSPLDGHPNPSVGFPFFDCATGSLGQGLSCACGLALGARLDKIDKHIYVLIGDAESREGQIWEACDFIMDYNLHEVIPIFNCNGFGQSDPVSQQQSQERIALKLKAFGFKVNSIDGHDPTSVQMSIEEAKNSDTPLAIVAKTVKGWCINEMQKSNYHGKPLKEEQLKEAYSDLDRFLESKGYKQGTLIESLHHPYPTTAELPKPLQPSTLADPDFAHLLKDDPFLSTFNNKNEISTRRAYGLALRELAENDSRVVALDGDVKNSTFSDYMAKAFKDRFFESKIAEQNMISVAAGLSASAKIPFVSSFARFLERGYDQFELSFLGCSNIKLCGSHTGANIGADGPSQMGLSDLAFMRSFTTVKNSDNSPLLVIFNPACAVTAYKCVQLMADFKGPCYMRTMRSDLPLLYPPNEQFEIGGVKVLKEGKDIAILATGYMVHAVKKLISELNQAGIDVSLVDCYSFPITPEHIANIATKSNGKLVTIEDNYGNSLGSEVASIVASDPSINAIVRQLFVKRLPKSGLSSQDVLDFVGLGL